MLAEILALNAFNLVLVFARLGALLMVAPAISATYVPTRVRLLLAVVATLVLAPVVAPGLPPMPEAAAALVLLIVGEVFVGLFLGFLGQMAMSALHLAGTAIGRESGLMNAMVFDPVTEQQGALVIGLLSNVVVLLMMVIGLHHLFFEAAAASYGLFVPGEALIFGDHAATLLDVLARAFYIGLQLAAPFVVYALSFQTVLGLMARISPQMNVFFVGLPLQIMLGLVVLGVALPTIAMWFLGFFEDVYVGFLTPA